VGSPVVNNVDPQIGEHRSKVSNLCSPNFSRQVHAAGSRNIIERGDWYVVGNLAEEFTDSPNQIEMRFKLRTIKMSQDVDDLPLAAAAIQRPDRKQNSNSIWHRSHCKQVRHWQKLGGILDDFWSNLSGALAVFGLQIEQAKDFRSSQAAARVFHITVSQNTFEDFAFVP